MPIAVVLAGVTQFLILDGVDQFPLLAIAMAPSVLGAALLLTTGTLSPLALVFFPVLLSPTNPQAYNPETYLFSSLMAITSVILLFVLLRTVLPTSDASAALVPDIRPGGAARPAGRQPLPTSR